LSGDLLFDQVVTTEELLEATGDQAWLQAMLQAEAALSRACASAGLVPPEAARQITAVAEHAVFDAAELGRQARGGGNPVIPLVKALSDAVGPPCSQWVHMGATSQDILDTAMVLVSRKAGAIVDREAGRLARACADQARQHRDTVMPARTLLQPALPTTFGLKAVTWMVGVCEARRDLKVALESLSSQLGGAAGTLASLGDHGPAVAAAFAAELRLDEPVLPWHAARQRTARLATSLALVASTAAKIAFDIALLMQAEVAEATEPFAEGRGASSTMPQKRNPVAAAAVGAASRRAGALACLMMGSVVGEHERHLASWPTEWQTLGDLLALAGGAVSRSAETVEGLEVHADTMAANVTRFAGSLLAERVSSALTPALGRLRAAELVGRACRLAPDTGAAALIETLMSQQEVAEQISEQELRRLLDPTGYLGCAQHLVDKALAWFEGESS